MQSGKIRISSRTILIIVGLIILGLLVWRFFNIVTYILIATVLSLITRPLVRLMGRIKIGKFRIPVSIRALLTLFVIWGFFFGFFRIFIPLIASEAQELSGIDSEQIMAYMEKPLSKLNDWYNRMNFNGEEFTSIENLVQEKIKSVLNISLLTNLIGTIAGVLGNIFWAIFAISFITFFLLREEKLLSESLVLLLPKEYEAEIRHALASVKYLLRRYFIGILVQMTGILTLVTVGMTIAGVGFRHGIIIGLLAAVLNIIPYLGPWLGAALGVTLGVATHLYLDFSTELLPLIGYMVIVFAVTQLTDNTIFQPFIFGTSVMAHPLEIFIVIMIAGSLAGVVGMILAIPTYTVLRVFAKEFFNNFRLIQKLTERI
ncbi:MAG: AI-2E family transporter [Bacteroidales bacterium]|nr:AI-2E family transporter [Bacteroidales bacterium]MBN2699438.1 AI-2E family transporter [Bacteroidales bacterium]